jgi:hypothetical protein
MQRTVCGFTVIIPFLSPAGDRFENPVAKFCLAALDKGELKCKLGPEPLDVGDELRHPGA